MASHSRYATQGDPPRERRTGSHRMHQRCGHGLPAPLDLHLLDGHIRAGLPAAGVARGPKGAPEQRHASRERTSGLRRMLLIRRVLPVRPNQDIGGRREERLGPVGAAKLQEPASVARPPQNAHDLGWSVRAVHVLAHARDARGRQPARRLHRGDAKALTRHARRVGRLGHQPVSAYDPVDPAAAGRSRSCVDT